MPLSLLGIFGTGTINIMQLLYLPFLSHSYFHFSFYCTVLYCICSYEAMISDL